MRLVLQGPSVSLHHVPDRTEARGRLKDPSSQGQLETEDATYQPIQGSKAIAKI